MPQQHHFVSKGYQKNFSTEGQRLTVLNARTGEIKAKDRPTKSNWTAPDWNSFIEPDGKQNPLLENQWSKIEASALNRCYHPIDHG